MTEAQASKVLQAASGQPAGYVKVVKVKPGRVRGDSRRLRHRRAGVRYVDAPRRSRERDRHRPGYDHLPLLPRGTRARRRRDRKPKARSTVRAVDHARPAPWRAAQTCLGSCGPRQRSHPRVAVGEQDRRRQDPKSKRSLMLPKRAITALQAHKKRQAAERLAAGTSRTTTSCSAMRTGACTPATRSTGGSAR
jgi:hypothetical protein